MYRVFFVVDKVPLTKSTMVFLYWGDMILILYIEKLIYEHNYIIGPNYQLLRSSSFLKLVSLPCHLLLYKLQLGDGKPNLKKNLSDWFVTVVMPSKPMIAFLVILTYNVLLLSFGIPYIIISISYHEFLITD